MSWTVVWKTRQVFGIIPPNKEIETGEWEKTGGTRRDRWTDQSRLKQDKDLVLKQAQLHLLRANPAEKLLYIMELMFPSSFEGSLRFIHTQSYTFLQPSVDLRANIVSITRGKKGVFWWRPSPHLRALCAAEKNEAQKKTYTYSHSIKSSHSSNPDLNTRLCFLF